MKERIAIITTATVLGLGGWFANDFGFHRVDHNQSTLVTSQESPTKSQNSLGEQTLDQRTPEMVSRVNAAIALLEQCPDTEAKEAAKTFLSINNDSKIAMAYGNEIGKNALGVVIVAINKDSYEPQIGISPQTLLDPLLSDQELAKQILKTVYVYEAIKNKPEPYEQDQNFKNLINNQADRYVLTAFCTK